MSVWLHQPAITIILSEAQIKFQYSAKKKKKKKRERGVMVVSHVSSDYKREFEVVTISVGFLYL
jgi:hypothetical protein